ncbi:chloramphenicol acetyltransferase [Flavobacterium sp. 20NA77.7]|uniref:Chloramphenicol acetyltransferase n=1 Tax=Flavobacterium nakdongensis TaxID=3073563 RepID=A0ABY9R9X5_9FLAO|nr:chloramphenicol acetyltransferase [Flavobacterium sp. 20NA77.7]WMW78036.1 chloramphenicol acetyltransferase [Flavobacterium sp. 20NA77.7]
MKQTIDLATWNRKEHFEFFSTFEEPFFGITTPIDMTIAYEKAKAIQIPFFVYYLHKTIAAVNQVENFRYRIEENEVVLYDEIDASSTIMREDKTFGFSFMKFNSDIHEFTKIVQTEIKRIQVTPGLFTREFPGNIIHFSAIPWINFTGLTHSRSYTLPDSCPKVSWGKLIDENGQKTMSMAVMAHHGLIDGYHMGLFIEILQTELNK